KSDDARDAELPVHARAQGLHALVRRPRLDAEMSVRDDVAAADVEARADEVAYEGRAVAFGREDGLLAAVLERRAVLGRLRFRVAQGASRARLEEHVGAGDEADAVAVLAEDARREREAVDDLLVLLVHLAELLIDLAQFALLPRELVVLLVDQL